MDLNILQLLPTTRPQYSGEAAASLTTRPVTCSGMRALMQIVYITLMRVAGRDAFAPWYGAGLSLLVDGGVTTATKRDIEVRVSLITANAETQILEEQAKHAKISPDERLQYLKFIGLVPSATDPTLYVIIMEMASQAGVTQNIDLPIAPK